MREERWREANAGDQVRLVSAASGAKLLGVTPVQAAELGASGVLGAEYSVRVSEAASPRTFYDESLVEELGRRAHFSKDDVRRLAARHGYSRIVLVRQIAPRPMDDPADDRREWYGMNYRAVTSADPHRVRAQEEATRRWWEISPSNQEYFRSLAQRGERAMLISTISGFVALCRDITGLDEEMYGYGLGGFHAYSIAPAGAWGTEIEGRWIDSGRGRAMLTWDPLTDR